MRAGLLSDPEIIELINSKFVSTWTIVDDGKKLAEQGNPLARTLISNWNYPLDLMFLSEEGAFLNKLNSVGHLYHDIHKDVSHPAALPGPTHKQVLRQHIERYFQAD